MLARAVFQGAVWMWLGKRGAARRAFPAAACVPGVLRVAGQVAVDATTEIVGTVDPLPQHRRVAMLLVYVEGLSLRGGGFRPAATG